MRLALALALVVAAGCSRIHYVTEECPQCRVLNARTPDGKQPLPRLPKSTKRLFVLVPGALGYSWEWNPAVRSLEQARGAGVEFVVFWWEPWSSVRSTSHTLAHWVNDLLAANELPELTEINVVAHSMAGIVAAYAVPDIQPTANAHLRLVTIGTPWAGMIGPNFGYVDSAGSPVILSSFAPWLHYPSPGPDVEIVEYRTTWPEDPVMEPRFGHDPAPTTVGPLPRVRVNLPHMDHNKCVGLVVDRLLRNTL